MAAPTGKLVVLSGPSGAGKTSVVAELRRDPRVEFSVSATTRTPRRGEHDGVDYHFVTREEFERLRAAGELLEWAEYNQQLYGTPRPPMQAALARGRCYVLEIEVHGTRQLREQRVPGIYIFLVPPSLDHLRRRLMARGLNDENDIARRLAIAENEMRAENLYDHVVVNEDLATAVAEVKRLIGLEP